MSTCDVLPSNAALTCGVPQGCNLGPILFSMSIFFAFLFYGILCCVVKHFVSLVWKGAIQRITYLLTSPTTSSSFPALGSVVLHPVLRSPFITSFMFLLF